MILAWENEVGKVGKVARYVVATHSPGLLRMNGGQSGYSIWCLCVACLLKQS